MCDTEELAELTQALMTIGQMMGALIFPSLSGMYTVNGIIAVLTNDSGQHLT